VPPFPLVNSAVAGHGAEQPAVLEFRNVTKRFGSLVAVDDVSMRLHEGQTVGLVGESGSGKTTCVRLALGLERPSSGDIAFRGTPFPSRRRRLAPIRRQIGFVFQDPYDSLDPRMTLADIVSEPMRVHGVERATRQHLERLLSSVGLPEAPLDSRPAAYSGGGRQRIAIARALALDPEVLICDEPTASLDVSVQAQILNLLQELRAERALTMLVVSHDLDIIRRMCDRMVVMYAGRIMEVGEAATVRARPAHPYTAALLDSVPATEPSARRTHEPISQGVDVAGREGCVFAGRCPRVRAVCRELTPPHQATASGFAACHFPLTASTLAEAGIHDG
jgi:oligopeptide/dipeptide ABC transporter ATP-binding protein